MTERQHVQDLVDVNLVGVKAIEKKENIDVYCLGTKKNGNFIANGIVVKNCDALRYICFTHFFGKEQNQMNANDIDRLYNETRGAGYDLPAPFRDIPGLEFRF